MCYNAYSTRLMGVPKTMKYESSSGLDTLGVLQIIFIVLKCVNVIDWSWWVVFIPTWINIGIIAIAAIALVILDSIDD